MEKEIFKNYIVNDKGEVFSKKRNRKMKTSINHKGYEQIYLVVDGNKLTTTVHRLVCIAFLNNPNKLPQVNHIDGDKLNNNLSNLEWVSDKQNQEHAFKNGLKKRKSISMLDLNTGEENTFKSIKECANFLSTTQYNVSRVCSGKRKTLFKRYIFEYSS